MKAIEFTTKPKDGIIEIPKKYIKKMSKEIGVIILISSDQADQKQENSERPLFTSLKIKTKGLEFDRDEANKR